MGEGEAAPPRGSGGGPRRGLDGSGAGSGERFGVLEWGPVGCSVCSPPALGSSPANKASLPTSPQHCFPRSLNTPALCAARRLLKHTQSTTTPHSPNTPSTPALRAGRCLRGIVDEIRLKAILLLPLIP